MGNLSFYTTEEQINELFSKCGDIKKTVMGLDKVKKTPCGFCFVEYPPLAEFLHCVFQHPSVVLFGFVNMQGLTGSNMVTKILFILINTSMFEDVLICKT